MTKQKKFSIENFKKLCRQNDRAYWRTVRGEDKPKQKHKFVKRKPSLVEKALGIN